MNVAEFWLYPSEEHVVCPTDEFWAHLIRAIDRLDHDRWPAAGRRILIDHESAQRIVWEDDRVRDLMKYTALDVMFPPVLCGVPVEVRA